jgi:NAD(P)-dependent dehydrogenase (short-subunit alcohol dehydrogenase family)
MTRFIIVAWTALFLSLAILPCLSLALSTLSSPTATAYNNNKRVVILGGTGRIGTAVAIHLLRRDPTVQVVLVGRRPNQGKSALQEVLSESKATPERISLSQIDTIWKESETFQALVDSADCLIHTAGPYSDQKPVPLKMALQSKKCQAYVDISDPLSYLEQSLLLSHEAQASNLTALVAAGAFPGMSNVLAKEASQVLVGQRQRVQDVRFNYFTAGLGGSGVVNLYITNLGFGEPMVQYDRGELRWYMALSGLLLGKVDFFLPHLTDHPGNELAKQRVGRKTVFAWPFPEAATVAKNVKARGNSYAAMGTAPDIWNAMLGILVKLVPRTWWKNTEFSKFMADFSQPLVLATDALLQQTTTTGGTGETHAIRVDVTSVMGPRENDDSNSKQSIKGVSIVQAHDSFRQCVGQSCAEFALDLLNHPKPGVYLPEQFYEDSNDRSRILEKLTTTPGTFCYTGPVTLEKAPSLPSDWDQAILEANQEEARL